MYPGIGSGSAELSRTTVPTFENSGQCWGSRVPSRASASVQTVLPSAAFGLIENPSGITTLEARSSEGEGVVGSWNWGTSSSTPRPEGESVSSVVGFALRLGLKLSRSQPVVAGHASPAVSRSLSYANV